MTTGYILRVNDRGGYSAHVCGITPRDQVLLYATMNSKTVTDGRAPVSETYFKDDILKANTTGKHLVLVVKHNPM